MPPGLAATVRAAVVARISKEDEGNIENVDIQVQEGLAFIERQDWTHAGTFADNNLSAYSGVRRPGYERLLVAIRKNEIDAIVCTETSRLNRRLWESIDLFRLALTTDLKRIVTTDGQGGFDLSTNLGIQNAINAAMEAEKESLRLSTRQKRKQQYRAERGRPNGGPRRYGREGVIKDEHGNVTNKSRINRAIVGDEAAVIREIFRRILDGKSSREIVKWLNSSGYKTATGKRWYASNIQKLVDSPHICGYRTHLGVEYPSDEIPPIVSRKDWELAGIIWHSRGTRGITPKRYLLSGIVVCGSCGRPMVGRNYHEPRSGKVYPRYQCTKSEAYHYSGCGKVFRLADPIDLLVSEAVLHRLDSPDFARVLSLETNSEELQALLNEREAWKAKKQDLVADYAARLLDRNELAQAKLIVEENLERVNKRLSGLRTGFSLGRIPLDKSLREVWQDADLDFKRDLIKLLIKEVVVLPGRTQHIWRFNGHAFRFDPSLIRIEWTA
jgi:DNA invertase Pin-like site-specific DNA recombinase